MKPMIIVLGLALAIGGCPHVMGATLLIDNFTGPALQIGGVPPLLPFLQSANDAPLPALRVISGQGGPEWVATSDPLTGTLTYAIDLRRGQHDPGDGLGFRYGYADRLAGFAGLNSVQLQVESVVGSGTVSAYVPTGSTIDEWKLDLVPGAMVVPLLNPSGENPMRNIVIRIYPTTPNFSVTLSSLSLVPEPGAGMLVVAAGGWLSWRRRRGAGGNSRRASRHSGRR